MPIVKKTTKKNPEIKSAEKKSASVEKREKYLEAVGRRKTSVARIRITDGKGIVMVNGKKLAEYFNNPFWQNIVLSPIEKSDLFSKSDISVRVTGGGVNSQAEAIRHGIARVLVEKDPSLRGVLKAKSYLKRDPRMKERKKYGLKKARRAPQWSKR